MAFTTSGREALRKLEQNAFDVIVADMHMPEIGGAELFTEVMRLYPQTVRILLSDNAGLDLVLRSSTTAHQFLTKPCDAATLRRTLDRALRIREMLASPGLRTVVSRMTSLPTLPAMYTKLVASLDDPEISSRELGERAQKVPHFFGALASVSQGRLVPVAGGVLIHDEERNVVGAVGISGDTSDRDEDCALNGVRAAGLLATPTAAT